MIPPAPPLHGGAVRGCAGYMFHLAESMGVVVLCGGLR
jgi:hypothetical protein